MQKKPLHCNLWHESLSQKTIALGLPVDEMRMILRSFVLTHYQRVTLKARRV